MIKKLLTLSAFFALFCGQIFAQVNPPCPVPPPPGAENCQGSCVYCDFDGYMGINNGNPSGGNTVCGAIAIHNDQWFGFTAGTNSITITIIPSNCVNGDGLQSAFFDDCSDPDAIICNSGSPGGGGAPLVLSYDNFTIGETYFLMLDGWSGDICDFEIDITDGSIDAGPPGLAGAPQGPTVVCPGAVVEYHIDDVPGAGNYIWTAPPGSQINGGGTFANLDAPEGNTVTITFGNSGGNVCVQADNACYPVTPQACLPVVNQPIPPTIRPQLVVCYEDAPFTWDEEPYPVLSVPGIFTLTSAPYQSYLGCDSLVKQTIVVKQIPPKNLGTQYTCIGSCFTLAGEDYCDAGTYNVIFDSFQGCDSTVTFALVVLDPLANIQPPANSIDCNSSGVLLNSAGSTPLGQATYAWTNANWTVLSGTPTYNATLTGTYHLIVTANGGGIQCRDTATVVVTGNTVAPNATATGGNINCISPQVTLAGGSTTPGVTYTWTGPGINAGNQFQQNPTVSQVGVYVLTVRNPTNGCTSTATVNVLGDVTPPSATAVGGTITCTQPNITIDGTTNAASATWFWTGPGINAGNQTLQDPNVLVDGTYNVTVTNTVSGCTNTATVTVDINNTNPTVAAGPDQTLTCLAPNTNLQGSGTAGGQAVTFAWTGPNGFTSTVAQPSVSDSGIYILTVLNTVNGCSKKDTVAVASNQTLPTATAGADSIITCAQPSVTLIGTGSSAGANFTLLWSGPGINATNSNQYEPTVDQQGTYTVLITNTTSGCTATDQVLVDLNTALPTALAGADDQLTCTTTTDITLNGSGVPGTVTFLWTGPGIGANNETLPNPTVTQPGTYDLVVTNPVNGCTATDQVIVTQDANVPTAAGGADLVLNCSVSTVDLDASASSSGNGITYTWSGPGINATNINLQSPTGLTAPGTYSLTVTNTLNSCVNTDIVVIQIDTAAPTANAGNALTLNCFNNATDTLDASASSLGSIFTLLWTGPGINALNESLVNPIINNVPGSYTLVVTNTDNTCTATDQVNIVADLTAPTSDAGVDHIIDCVATSTTLGGSSSSGANFTYLWTGADITAANQNQATPTVSLPGTYTLVVTNTINGCTASNDAVVNTNAVFPTALAGNDGLLTCANLTATLDGSASSAGANFQVLWSGPGINAGNQNQPSPSVTVPGTYVISITDASNSCISRDTVVVDENKVIPIADAGIDFILDCTTTSVTLDGSLSNSSPTIEYLWTGAGINASNQNDQNPPVDQPDTYELLLTDTANGCTSTDQAVVTQDIVVPTAAAGLDMLINCTNTTQTLNGSASSTGGTIVYVWQGPGINSTNFNLVNPTVDQPGNYTLTVENSQNHCSATDVVFVDDDVVAPLTIGGADGLLTCAATTSQLDASQSSSASGAAVTFLWDGPGIVSGGTTATPVVNAPGVYLLTVTDSNNGCTNVDAVNVNENVLQPTVAAGNDLVITCANASQGVTLLSAGSSTGAGFAYLWSGPGITPTNATQANPVVLVPGTYTLQITDIANGCTNTDDALVNADQNLPTASAGLDQTITCAATDAVLDGSGSSSPNGTLLYTWAGPGINPGNINGDMPTVLQSGTYSLTVTNSVTGCSASDQVIVNLDNTPPTATATSDLITCADPTSTVAITSSLPNSTYLWEGPDVNPNNNNNQSIQVDVAGIYAVTVTAPNGCTTTTSTLVELDADVPQGAAEGAVLNCLNGGTSLISGEVISPAGSTITWSGPGIGTVTTPEVTVTQAGVYTFTMFAPNGCVRPLTVNVTSDFVEPTIAVVAAETIDCNTSIVTINGGGSSVGPNFTYNWTTNSGHFVDGTNTLQPTVDRPGFYTLSVVNNLNGCENIDSVEVEIDPLVPSGFDVTVRNIRCFGDVNGSITVNGIQGGTAPFIFTLSGSGSANNQYTGLSAGSYVLALEDANGCQLDTTISIIDAGQLQVSLGADVEVSLGEMATVTGQIQSTIGIQSATWNYAPGCDPLDEFCETFTYLPYDSYRHTLTVVDSNGCVARDEVLVIVQKNRQVYVPNIFNPESDLNFSLGVFTGVDVAKINFFNIFDRWGNQVFNVKEYIPTPGAAPDATQSWDGSVRGDKGQVGVYVWYCEVEFIDGEVKLFKGDVTLLR